MAETLSNGRAIDRLLAEYGESHENPTNKLIHWIAVPAIAWTVLALLWEIPTPAAFSSIPYLNWCTIAVAITLVYYIVLSPPLAFGMIFFTSICIAIILAYENTTTYPLWRVAIAVFVIAWIFQFIGHKIEGKKPSFFKDVQFLLIGPAWLMHFLFKKAGLRY